MPCEDHATHCLAHQGCCRVNPTRDQLQNPQALVINSAGSCCQGWSYEGKRDCHAHTSQTTLATWLVQRQVLARRGEESMFFHENTPGFDLEGALAQHVWDTHALLSVCAGPHDLGWPTSRRRRLSCGLSRRELVWVGPQTAEGIQAEFDVLFQRKCLLNGDVFLQAGNAEVHDWAVGLSRKRLRCASDEVPLSGDGLARAVLSCGQLQRLEAYKKRRLSICALDGTCLVDLDHWPDSPGPSAGPHFPSLLRHGCIVNLKQPLRFAQATDRFLSLGFHVSKAASARFRWPLTDEVLSMKDRATKSLSGNCQSLPAVLAWTLYVLCNCIKREQPSLTMAVVRCRSDEFADDEA